MRSLTQRMDDLMDIMIPILGVLSVLGLIALLTAVPIAAFGGAPGAGTDTGYVFAVETAGLIWQTHRVYVKTSPEATNSHSYCVTNADLLPQLRALAETGDRVTFDIHRPSIWLWPWQCGGESDIVRGVRT